MQVQIEHLYKTFGGVTAVKDLNLQVNDGEFVAFLGPSGCGKTTTLLMLAGIYKPTSGVMRFGERVVNTLQPRERNIGMVFQSYALYPHMTIFNNIAYPLKLQGLSSDEQRKRVQRIAEVMEISHLLERRPSQLSGGQQQRVALGRALVKEPDILLFDEPLSNLDARLRLTMRGEIKALQKRMGITSIYVTHDQIEALTMADRIAVMNEGVLEAYDTPDDLYNMPKTLFIAGFVGNPPMNLIPVEMTMHDGTITAQADGFQVHLTGERAEKAAYHARQHAHKLMLGIRPEDVIVQNAGSDGALGGTVAIVEPLGREDMIDVRVGDAIVNDSTSHAPRLVALVSTEQRVRMGDTVHLSLNMSKLHFFDLTSRQSILRA